MFMDEANPKIQDLGLAQAMNLLDMVTDEMGVDKAELACSFIRAIEEIDYAILGSETPDQVREDAELMAINPLDKGIVEEIVAMSAHLDQRALDPRYWNK